MARLGVVQRGNLVDSLTTILETCADKVGAGFRLLTEPFLQPGEQVPDMALAVQLLGRMMAKRSCGVITSISTNAPTTWCRASSSMS